MSHSSSRFPSTHSASSTSLLVDSPTSSFYNLYSRTQAQNVKFFSDSMPQIVEIISDQWKSNEQAAPKVIHVADYGSSGGNNSVPIVEKFIANLSQQHLSVRSSSSNTRNDALNSHVPSILVFHEDVIRNDWHSLFSILNEHPSYNSVHPYVSYAGIGRSFYKQVLPSDFVHFAFSSTAFHWIEGSPELSDEDLYSDEKTQERWRIFALTQWKTILSHRWNELVDGGVLAINVGCRSHEGKTGMEESKVYFKESLSQLVKENIFSLQSKNKIQTPFCFFHLPQDLIFPEFENHTGFKVVKFQVYPPNPNPYYEEYLLSKDIDLFVENTIQSMKAISVERYLNILSSHEKDSFHKETKVEEFFKRIASFVRSDPKAWEGTPYRAMIILKKSRMHKGQTTGPLDDGDPKGHGPSQKQHQ